MTVGTRPGRVHAHRESGWALDLELRQLRAFVVLLEAGSLSAAARSMGVAQSTMSEAVAALERALGTRVVMRKRGGHAVALTPAGEALLPHARNVLAALEDAHVAVASVAHDIRSRIEVIANESVSTYLLPTALAQVRKDWPHVRFAVMVGMCPSIAEGLATARYDVGLMLQTVHCTAENDVSEQPGHMFLAEVPIVAFASVRHPLATRAKQVPVPREELNTCRLFISDARGYFFDMVRDFFHSDGIPDVALEPIGSVEAVKQSVLTDDLAVGILPWYAIADEIRHGRLRTLQVRPELPRVRLEAMLYRARPPAHPATAALLEAIRRRLHRPLTAEGRRVPNERRS